MARTSLLSKAGSSVGKSREDGIAGASQLRSVDQLVPPCAAGPAGGRRGVSFAATGHVGVGLFEIDP